MRGGSAGARDETTMSARPGGRWRRHAGRTLLAVGALLVSAELLALLLFAPVTGRSFAYGPLRDARCARLRDLARKQGKPVRRGAGGMGFSVHPFLGYAPTREGVEDRGLWLPGAPPEDDDTFTVGVLGGSVAYRLCRSGALERALDDGGACGNRRVAVVPLAVEGYRQPQQLHALILALLAGRRFDAVVSLDGLNEASLGMANLRHGVHPLLPDHRMLARLRDVGQRALSRETLRILHRLQSLGRRERRVLSLAETAPLRYSVAANLAGHLLAASARRQAAALEHVWAERLAREAEEDATPGDRPVDGEAAARLAEVWAAAVRFAAAICREQRIPYLAFVQPSLYVPAAKPLTPAEQRLVPEEDPAVLEALRRIRIAADACRAAGLSVHDLTDVFADTEATVYVDFCHLNERGETILARRIADLHRGALRRTIQRAGMDSREGEGP